MNVNGGHATPVVAAMMCLLAAGMSSESIADVISLLHMDGTNGSTSFVDATGKAWVSTGAEISIAQARWDQSAFFAGTSDYLTAGNAADFSFGSDPFTVDFWMNPSTLGDNTYLAGRSNPGSGLGFDIRLDRGEILLVGVNGWSFNIGTYAVTDAQYVITNEWQHIAISATTSNVYLFYNGVLTGSSARATITDGGNPFRLGYQANFGGGDYEGYLDEFRISDTALWTADFTPPTSPGAVPEPTSGIVVFGAVIALAGLRWRQRR